jgi:hypothetical protein
MSFWEIIRELFKCECKEFNFIKVEHNDNSKKFEVKSEQFFINTKKIGETERQKIVDNNIVQQALDAKYVLLESSSINKLKDFRDNDKRQDTRKIINFLQDKIPSSDINIWRASLFLRNLYNKGDFKTTHSLKSEIRQKYGDRGGNIANLCTAGYFEDFLFPSYQEQIKEYEEKEAIKKFNKLYSHIVEELPFAVFVNYKSTIENIKREILKKKRYGFPYINIHGIGEANIQKIKDSLAEIKDIPIKNKKSVEEGNRIFIHLDYIK